MRSKQTTANAGKEATQWGDMEAASQLWGTIKAVATVATSAIAAISAAAGGVGNAFCLLESFDGAPPIRSPVAN